MDYFIPQSQIAEIQQATDIVELISSYIPLTKAGANYKTLCPFHEEKTPSFVVNPTKQIFHCFGCHKGGNVYGFLMAHDKISFPEAVRILARRSGIKLATNSPQDEAGREKRAELFKINRVVADFYHRALLDSHGAVGARNYLAKRGFTQAMIARFLVGFAPNGWDYLVNFAQSKKIPLASLAELGLILPRKEQNGYYDRFRNRVMFPIFNPRDGVVGFGGRVLDDSQPVYLNSPESILFDKGKSLYGLNFAKDACLKTGQICLVEGYTDVIMAHQCGFEYVVATLGTALTANHIKSIRRYADKVIALYDADPAGDMASARSLDLFLAEEINLSVARLPEGLDPYDCLIRKDGKDVFQKSIAEAVELFTSRLNLVGKKYNLNNLEEKARAVDEMLATIAIVPNVVRRNLYLKQLSETVNVAEEILRARIVDAGRRSAPESNRAPLPPSAVLPGQRQDFQAGRQIIEIMLNRNDFIPLIRDSVNLEHFPTEPSRQIAQKIFTNYNDEGRVTVDTLLNYLVDDAELSGQIVDIAQKNTIKDYEECLREWLSFIDRRHKKMVEQPVLKQQLKAALSKGDQQQINQILAKIQEMRGVFSTR